VPDVTISVPLGQPQADPPANSRFLDRPHRRQENDTGRWSYYHSGRIAAVAVRDEGWSELGVI
jgi:hypothetical protein